MKMVNNFLFFMKLRVSKQINILSLWFSRTKNRERIQPSSGRIFTRGRVCHFGFWRFLRFWWFGIRASLSFDGFRITRRDVRNFFWRQWGRRFSGIGIEKSVMCLGIGLVIGAYLYLARRWRTPIRRDNLECYWSACFSLKQKNFIILC